jgi:hypothetical protein
VIPVFCLDRRATQCLAVAHQLVQTLGPAWDLADHPGLEHLAKLLQVGLIEQVEEGGIRRPALEIEAKGLVQRHSVPLGECLQITGAAAAAQDPEYRHQQQEPLRVAHSAAEATVRDGLKEADQVIRYGLIDCSRASFGHWEQ